MTRNLLTIIIPVRSEEETILTTIERLEKTVRTPHDILIADDTVDPEDRTVEIVKDFFCHPKPIFRHPERSEGSHSVSQRDSSPPWADQNDTIHITISPKNKGEADGFGPALVRAIRKVKTPYTVIVMADLSDDPKSIDRMVSMMRQQSSDVVVGCRYMKGAQKIGGPRLQGIFSMLLNLFLYFVLRFPTRDSTNAFKLYRTDFLQSMLPNHPESGVEFSLQLTMSAVRQHGSMIDVPTTWRGREQGRSKVRLFERGSRYMKLVLRYLSK